MLQFNLANKNFTIDAIDATNSDMILHPTLAFRTARSLAFNLRLFFFFLRLADPDGFTNVFISFRTLT